MIGYKVDELVLDDYPSFMRYEEATIAPFAINRLAHSCCYNAWLMVSPRKNGNYIHVVYTLGMDPPNVANALVPYVPKDKDNYLMGEIEYTRFADSAEQYLSYAFKSYVGSLAKGPEPRKMFADATIEQICIDIDLCFEGDRRELMHIL